MNTVNKVSNQVEKKKKQLKSTKLCSRVWSTAIKLQYVIQVCPRLRHQHPWNVQQSSILHRIPNMSNTYCFGTEIVRNRQKWIPLSRGTCGYFCMHSSWPKKKTNIAPHINIDHVPVSTTRRILYKHHVYKWRSKRCPKLTAIQTAKRRVFCPFWKERELELVSVCHRSWSFREINLSL